MRKFHATYGAAVRFGPEDVSFITEEAWKEIYGYGHRQLPKAFTFGRDPLAIIGANDADHTRLRRSISPAFSAAGLQAQEPIVTGYVDRLIDRLKGVAELNLPTDMVKWYTLTTFDLIGDLAFGESFGGLENSEYHHWVSTAFLSIKAGAFLRIEDIYPLLYKVFRLLIPDSLLDTRQLEHAKVTVQKRLSDASAHGRGDFMDSILRHRGEKRGLTDHELLANSNVLAIAGSQSTTTFLSGATYW